MMRQDVDLEKVGVAQWIQLVVTTLDAESCDGYRKASAVCPNWAPSHVVARSSISGTA